MSQQEILQPILHRTDFYRKYYRRFVLWLILSISINAVLSGLVVIAFLDQKPPSFIVTTTDGQLIPVKAQLYTR